MKLQPTSTFHCHRRLTELSKICNWGVTQATFMHTPSHNFKPKEYDTGAIVYKSNQYIPLAQVTLVYKSRMHVH